MPVKGTGIPWGKVEKSKSPRGKNSEFESAQLEGFRAEQEKKKDRSEPEAALPQNRSSAK